jgi:hypothetical protein
MRDNFRAVGLIVLASVAIALSSKAALGQTDYFWNQNAAAGPQDWPMFARSSIGGALPLGYRFQTELGGKILNEVW